MDLLLVAQSIEVEDEEAGAGFVTEEGEEDISSLFASFDRFQHIGGHLRVDSPAYGFYSYHRHIFNVGSR